MSRAKFALLLLLAAFATGPGAPWFNANCRFTGPIHDGHTRSVSVW